MFKFMYCCEGVPSMSKVWTNIANAVVTGIVIKNSANITTELLIFYLVVVGGYELGKKLVDGKLKQMGVTDNVSDTQPNQQ